MILVLYFVFIEIEGQEERQKHLQKAEEEGLDVALITKTVVERIRMRDSGSAFPENSLAPDLVITEVNEADNLDFKCFQILVDSSSSHIHIARIDCCYSLDFPFLLLLCCLLSPNS